MVDEYQDTNGAQYELVTLLAAKYRNICVVGMMINAFINGVVQILKTSLDLKRYPEAKL